MELRDVVKMGRDKQNFLEHFLVIQSNNFITEHRVEDIQNMVDRWMVGKNVKLSLGVHCS